MRKQTQVHHGGDERGSAVPNQHEAAPPRANDRQVAGAHYKAHKFETWDVILDWNLGYLDGNAVKYLSRWRLKNGIEDLKKARHYIDKLIEVEQERANGSDKPT